MVLLIFLLESLSVGNLSYLSAIKYIIPKKYFTCITREVLEKSTAAISSIISGLF